MPFLQEDYFSYSKESISNIVLNLSLQAIAPWIIAFVLSLLTIYTLRDEYVKVVPRHNHSGHEYGEPDSPSQNELVREKKEIEIDEEEEHEDSYDIAMMLLVPYVAFLLAEALSISGYLVIIISAFFLSLYGKPNMHPGRAEFLRDILQTISYFFKALACVFMGISLPLHLQHL